MIHIAIVAQLILLYYNTLLHAWLSIVYTNTTELCFLITKRVFVCAGCGNILPCDSHSISFAHECCVVVTVAIVFV